MYGVGTYFLFYDAVYSMMLWGTGEYIRYFYLLPFFIALIGWKFFIIMRTIKQLAGTRALSVRGYARWKIMTRALLTIGSVSLLFMALLSPQWGTREHAAEQRGRDIIIALDISKSMRAQDCMPSRLSCAKNTVKELLKHLEADRVSLILFSGTAFTQVPLTRDMPTFLSFLEDVDTETISGGSTAFDKAIYQALSMFDDKESSSKALIMLTDGEDFSTALDDAARKAQQKKLALLMIGVGTAQGAPIPLYDEHHQQQGFIKKKDGSIVISRLDAEKMEALARATGGIYINAAEAQSIERIFKELAAYEKKVFGNAAMKNNEEQYPYFVFGSFLLYGMEWLL